VACHTGEVTISDSASPGQAARIDSLDILRGLMALSVAVYHFSFWGGLFAAGTRTNNMVVLLGIYGVEGFFIVSGFCFFHLYGQAIWDRRMLADFHVKRFFRIAPLYYLAVLLNLALHQAAGPGFTWRYLAENLTLTFGLFHPNHAMVLGGWSIGIEYVFYLAFPFLALLTRKKVALYLLTVMLLALAVHWTFGAVQAASFAGDQKFHTYVQIPNHAFLFLLGGVIAHLRSLTARRLPVRLFLPALVLLILAAIPRIVFYDDFDVMTGMLRVKYVSLCFLIVTLFAFFDVPRNVLRRPLVLLGDSSYSVYLLHPFIHLVLVRRLAGKGHPWVIFSLGLVLTLALAYLVYRLMEKPAIGLGRRVAGWIRGENRAT